MRLLASITAALLFLFLWTSTPAFSQQGDDRPEQQRDEKDRHREARPQEPQRDETRHDQGAEQRQGDRNADRHNDERRDSRPAAQPDHDRAQRPENENRVTRREDQRDAHGQRERIPDNRFRTSFGPQHHFRVNRTLIVNQSQPEFVYSGYTFQLADPWPAEWAFDDDCYVDYVDDDYYLFDAYHPGVRILVFVIGG